MRSVPPHPRRRVRARAGSSSRSPPSAARSTGSQARLRAGRPVARARRPRAQRRSPRRSPPAAPRERASAMIRHVCVDRRPLARARPRRRCAWPRSKPRGGRRAMSARSGRPRQGRRREPAASTRRACRTRRSRRCGSTIPCTGTRWTGTRGRLLAADEARRRPRGREGPDGVLVPARPHRTRGPGAGRARRAAVADRDRPARPHAPAQARQLRVHAQQGARSTRTYTRKIAQELLDKAIAQGEFDWVTEISEPVPISVLISILGLPGRGRADADRADERDGGRDRPGLPPGPGEVPDRRRSAAAAVRHARRLARLRVRAEDRRGAAQRTRPTTSCRASSTPRSTASA